MKVRALIAAVALFSTSAFGAESAETNEKMLIVGLASTFAQNLMAEDCYRAGFATQATVTQSRENLIFMTVGAERYFGKNRTGFAQVLNLANGGSKEMYLTPRLAKDFVKAVTILSPESAPTYPVFLNQKPPQMLWAQYMNALGPSARLVCMETANLVAAFPKIFQ